MAQIYERRKGDYEQMAKHLTKEKNYTGEILIQQYNRMLKLGLMDVHAQKLYVLTLRIEFLERFDRTPILFEDNINLD